MKTHIFLPLYFIVPDRVGFENRLFRCLSTHFFYRNFKKRKGAFKKLHKKLENIDTTGWPIEHQVDWHVIWAEMNGYDFNQRILKSWERDPAFYQTIWMYQSDVPAHEGPVNHALLEYWQYSFPLGANDKEKLYKELALIPVFLKQAEKNLTGNARDLWMDAVIIGLVGLGGMYTIASQDKNKDKKLFKALEDAKKSNDKLINWLESESPKKNGPSGIGKENYTWYQKNVHRIPLTWEEEVQLLQRELDRAWSSLNLDS